jgi:hypothetical protein
MEMSWTDGSTRIDKPDAHLWKPLRLLRERARAEREKALAAEVTNHGVDIQRSNDVTHGALPEWTAQPQSNGSVLMDMSIGLDLGPLEPEVATTTTTNGFDAWPTSIQPLVELPDTTSTMQPVTNQPAHATNYPTQQPILSQPPLPDMSGAWVDSTSASTGVADSAALMGDTSMNWETWDDLVEQWGVQNQDQIEGNGMGPAFFGGGSNWF